MSASTELEAKDWPSGFLRVLMKAMAWLLWNDESVTIIMKEAN